MNISYCTFTGVDEKTDLKELVRLSKAFPFVEWGLLYSPKRAGTGGRYMSYDSIKNILETMPSNVNLSVHFCGDSVANLLNTEDLEYQLFLLIEKRRGRVQLNFNLSKDKAVNVKLLTTFTAIHKDVEIITQGNENNAHLLDEMPHLDNHAILFDSSGGCGIVCTEWHRPIPNKHCGYAGGIGEENIDNVLNSIEKVVTIDGNQVKFWIDMEGSLREVNQNGEDLFNLERCEAIVTEVAANR